MVPTRLDTASVPMTIDQTISTLSRHTASAIVRTSSQDTARRAMDAAVRGGFRVVEFTLTTPGAIALIEEFAARADLLVGAGTVLTPDQAREAVRAGARYIVSPVVDEEVIHVARDLGVAAMPGAHTPTELLRADRAGAPLQKLFPAPAGGPVWVRSVLGPLPFLRIVPTNGVAAENAADWLAAGAFALGFVTPVFDPQDMRDKRYDRIEERARRVIEGVATARS